MAILPVGIGPQEGGYQIERSLRFNSADSAYLNRTFTTPTLSTKWTWNGWVKRSGLGASQTLFSASSDVNNWGYFGFLSGDTLTFSQADGGSVTSTVTTTQVFRDVGAWYCITIVFDTTQGTASNRLKMYVNGVQITAFGTASYLGSGVASRLNAATAHQLGRYFSAANYFSGYLTEVNFIDGQALDPTSFGEYNSETGVWQPKAYTGSYGTNGFYLDFADNSSTTALGYDAAGSNDWTPNNFSVTAGAGNDSLVDTPTPYGTDTGVGGEVRGNYATWNPLKFYSTTVPTLNNGNLQAAWNNTSMFCGSTIACPNGAKTYSEFTLDTANTTRIGIKLSSDQGQYTGGWTYIADSGVIRNTSDTNVQTGLSTSGNGTVIGIAVDLVANTLQFYRNGSTLGTSISIANASDWLFWVGQNGSGSSIAVTANFGQRPFSYTAPSGFASLCTQNLPEPTVKDGGDYFDIALYAGNGTNSNTVTTNFGFTPDFIWIKNRTAAADHALQSSPMSWRYLSSNTTGADGSAQVGSLTDNSFLLATANSIWNASSNNYAAWCWKAGGTGVSNTAGTITSTVSANTTAGFSIITYTGNGTSGATIGHGLSSAPAFFVVKGRSFASNWLAQHVSVGNGSALTLNSTAAASASSTYWNNTSPSSTVITLGNGSETNPSGSTMVCYAFAPVAGYSAFGSYTGNGSTDGPFVYTGFRPAYVLVKLSSTSGEGWWVHDFVRPAYNATTGTLRPNDSTAEENLYPFDLLSNGFKVRESSNRMNYSGQTFIYAAFAENPFKYSLAR